MLGETASAYGEVWHVPGAGPITGREFIDMAFKATDNKPDIGLLSENSIRTAGQMNPKVRELIELMYDLKTLLFLMAASFLLNFPCSSILPMRKGLERQSTGSVRLFTSRETQPQYSRGEEFTELY
jgi:hypothetical protein